MSTPCGKNVANASQDAVSSEEADQLLIRARRLYNQELDAGHGIEDALLKVQNQLKAEARVMELVNDRNRLLSLQAKRSVKAFVRKFPTLGEGLLAFMEGSSKTITGSRFSVDYQARANFGKYFGRFIATLDEHGATKDFLGNKHQQDVFRELWELGKEDGQPGRTGNKPAAHIAKAIHDVGRELVGRQNQAGAYIRILPGYVMRQTHDIDTIRALGGAGTSAESQSVSYAKWRDTILPLLDHNATFEGLDPEFVLRNIHQGIYSGFHGPDPDMANVAAIPYRGTHASKVSRERVLHFKDADSAYAYNQQFGMKSLRDQITSDIRFRTRSITLMENFGPAPKQLFDVIRGELHAEARNREDAAKQVDSLSSWKIEAAFNELSGHNDHPVNHTLSRYMNNIRMVAMMSKMGGVVLSSFGDKAFIQAESAYQGISGLETLGKQITTLFPRGADRERHLRLMGVALDGILGNVMGRYSPLHAASGTLHWAQKRFFDMNFMNWWNDANKAGIAELMAAHLAEHADMEHAALPMELSRVLNLYGINQTEWDIIRNTAWSTEDGKRFLTPDNIKNTTQEDLARALAAQSKPNTTFNQVKLLNELETKLRTYLVDRVDYAVPSPGVAETRLTNLNSRAGTPLGEAVRTIMMFKSFPITILQKTFGREIYGRGAMTMKEWLLHDHKGKFQLAQTIALATIGGYLSGVVKDALKGRTPKPLIKDGKIVTTTLNDAALRGGGLGIMGDLLFSEYDRQYRSFLGVAAGPVAGQLDPLADIITKMRSGEDVSAETVKFAQNNTPFVNLFYIKPVLDYFVLWNLQEAMNPGSLKRAEKQVEDVNQQGFFVRPSSVTR